MLQALTHPRWALEVGLLGRPHDLGNISRYRGHATGLADYIGWLAANFDPSISWSDLEWLRDFWQGQIIIKGILDPEDARDAVRFGADGIVVSNHGGRQLDGVPSTARALPRIAEAVGSDLVVLVDGGVRSGLDVIRMLALGAKGVLLGRATLYGAIAAGESGANRALDILREELQRTLQLCGAAQLKELNAELLVPSDR